jgi:hypothetical protein
VGNYAHERRRFNSIWIPVSKLIYTFADPKKIVSFVLFNSIISKFHNPAIQRSDLGRTQGIFSYEKVQLKQRIRF